MNDLRRFQREFRFQSRKFYEATSHIAKLRVLEKYPTFPELAELHAYWALIYDETDRDRSAIRSILMQAFDNLTLPIFESVTPDPTHSIMALDRHFRDPIDQSFHTLMDLPPQDGTNIELLSTNPNLLRIWDTNKIVGPFGTLGYNEWHLRWFKHRLLRQSEILNSIDHVPYGRVYKRLRFLETHPNYIKEMDLDNKYTYLYNSFHNANSKAFLTFYMLRELHLMYNGCFHGVITNYATYGFTAMTNLNVDTLKDPFKEVISESMLNYLGRFCTRIKRELFYEKLISKDLIGSNGLLLPTLPEATMKTIFEYVLPSNKFLAKEAVILQLYQKIAES